MSNEQADQLTSFLFDALPVRGAILHFGAGWRELSELHNYAPSVRAVLGQSLAGAALMSSSMKFEGMLTLQLKGQGALGMLIAQCNDKLQVRGMAGEPNSDVSAAGFGDLIGAGTLALMVDAKDAKDRYQGIVEVNATTLAAALTNYYKNSAQLDAHFVLLEAEGQLAGLMLQRMPDSGVVMAADDWARVCLMADTLTLGEAATETATNLIHKLFSEDDVRVFAARELTFACRCSDERAERAVQMLGQQDAEALLDEHAGQIKITCEFCNRTRHVDAVDVARVFSDAVAPGPDAIQ